MSRSSSIMEESLLPAASVISIVTSAGGAFHGHTIEAWDYERQVSALREEVRDALDESRRSKLYCQQVKKDLQNLISTELDGKQDTEMLGGISSLLTNTNTLVEKFAVFERYLREKIASDQQERESLIIDAAERRTVSLVDALREDVRETLKSFRHEILMLRNAQVADHASLKEHCANVTKEIHSELTEIVTTKFSNAEKNAGSGIASVQKVIEALEQRASESAAALKKFVTASLNDVRILIDESTKDLAKSRQLEDHRSSVEELRRALDKRVAELSNSISSCEQGIARSESNGKEAGARVERRLAEVDEQQVAFQRRIADLGKQLVACESGVETNAGLGSDHATRLERRIAAMETSQASLDQRFAATIDPQLKGLHRQVAELDGSIAATIEPQLKGLHRQVAEIDGAIKENASATRESLHAVEAKAREAHDDARRDINNLAASSRDNLRHVEDKIQESHTALETRFTSEALPRLAQRVDAVRDDVLSLQNVFISVFGRGSLGADSQPLISFHESLNTHRNQVVQDLLETHIHRLESSIRAGNESARELSASTHEQFQDDVQRSHSEFQKMILAAQEKSSHQLRRQALCYLSTNTSARRRGAAFHTWLSFARTSRVQRDKKKLQQRQWAVGVLERTVVPQLATALRRSSFQVWKRFIVSKRGQRRVNRTALTLGSAAQRQLAVRYMLTWLKYVKHIRRPKRYVGELLTQSIARTRCRYFDKWAAHIAHLRRRRTMHRDAHVLSLSGLRPIVGTASLASSSMHRDRKAAWQRLSPRGWSGLKQLWQEWVQLSWKRRYLMLRRTTLATDAVVESTRVDLGALVGQVRDVQETSLEFQKRVTFITNLFDAPRLSESTTKEANPSKNLVKAIQHLSSGYATIHDIFAFLSMWVDVVERTHRTLSHDVANLQAWSIAVDEEIRRVQKFVRPPFK